MNTITNYDPNIIWARHTVLLTFVQWDYSLQVEASVNGNCRGASLFGSAIDEVFYNLANSLIILSKNDGEDTLEIGLEDADELAMLCVSAQIVGHVEEIE